MKKKIISSVVISTVAAGMLIWVVWADFSKLSPEERIEIKTLIEKSKNWETLTVDEQKKLDDIKAEFEWRKFNWFWDKNNFKKWKRGFMKGLTDAERTSIEEMTDEERKAFFDERRELRKAEMEDRRVIREGHEAIIDKLINWEELTEEEDAIREEIKELRADRKAKKKELQSIIEKKKNWKELTEEEENTLNKHRWFMMKHFWQR